MTTGIDPLVADVMDTGKTLADAVRAQSAASLAKVELLEQLTASLIGSTNPLTNKAHSATSAEAAARMVPSYGVARDRVVEAEYLTNCARARYECARLRAWSAAVTPLAPAPLVVPFGDVAA